MGQGRPSSSISRGAQAVNPTQAEFQNDGMSPQPNAQSGRRGRVEVAQEAPCGDHQGMATSRIVTSTAPESEEETAARGASRGGFEAVPDEKADLLAPPAPTRTRIIYHTQPEA